MRLHARLLPFALLLPLALAGCGGDEPEAPPRVFTPPNYAYLTKLRLNVGEIDVEDHSVPGGEQDVSAASPTPPTVALTEMAHDRLFAAGVTGRAVFTIDQANIMRSPNGALSGTLAVHLDLYNAQGARAGLAQAQVSRQHVPGSDAEDQRGVLYDMTNAMMADMNVEIEFQIRRTLKDWLVSNTSVPAPVQAQPLQAPEPPIPFAAPPALPPPPEDGAPQQQTSPPPGYLQAPPGY